MILLLKPVLVIVKFTLSVILASITWPAGTAIYIGCVVSACINNACACVLFTLNPVFVMLISGSVSKTITIAQRLIAFSINSCPLETVPLMATKTSLSTTLR